MMKKILDLASENATYQAPTLEVLNIRAEQGFAASLDASGNEDMTEKEEPGVWG